MMHGERLVEKAVIFDVDGLRPDVFHAALREGALPSLDRIFPSKDEQRALHASAHCPAPSITFCCQASIFTGEPPARHGIVGNQFFDRFGGTNGGRPRFFAFDIGDTLQVFDALNVFFSDEGLANEILSKEVRTIYEDATQAGMRSVVAHNKICRGATEWLRPGAIEIARFTKGGKLFGLSARAFDDGMIEKVRSHVDKFGVPDVLTYYFMGLDSLSHKEGPAGQSRYLREVVDRQIGEILGLLEKHGAIEKSVFLIISDHGQIEVKDDSRHSLRMSFPFERDLGHLFDALGLDVHDLPGEAPDCDAVVASNGGLAHVYIHHREGRWRDAPRFEEDVLPVARAFMEANRTGRYAEELQGSLLAVLVRDAGQGGWYAPYFGLLPDGSVGSLDGVLQHPRLTADAAERIRSLSCPHSGDIILVADTPNGFYFGAPARGMHGGLSPEESDSVMSFGWPGVTKPRARELAALVAQTLAECSAAHSRGLMIQDAAHVLRRALGI